MYQAGQYVGIMQNTPYNKHLCQALILEFHIQ
jgi:hypothetical protein